ncbi:MAG TPA: PQQ-dependent sugar dehydrogenase, partial [Anaerolineae bacterium]|nr:PQQ-dependent sugar dehydrogenase [Anaerolineae bacterium]
QGAALHPETGELWTHEHGPQGGDEINTIRAGVNYGWPVITYGVNYVSGTRIGEGTHKPGMAQPLHIWTPSIAPSGMTFYTGDQFPRWRGNLFIGALRGQMLVRLQLDGDKVISEERILENSLGRIRDVRQGPDGFLYLLTDAQNGLLVRLEPAEKR